MKTLEVILKQKPVYLPQKKIRKVRTLTCKRCGEHVETTATHIKYCPPCSQVVHKEQMLSWYQNNKERKRQYKRKKVDIYKNGSDDGSEVYIPEPRYAPHTCARCSKKTTNRMLCNDCIEYANTIEHNL